MLCWLLYSTYPVLGICASSARPSRCLVHFDFSLPSSGLFKFVPLVRRIDRLNSLWGAELELLDSVCSVLMFFFLCLLPPDPVGTSSPLDLARW